MNLRTLQFDQFTIARELKYTLGPIWKDYLQDNIRLNHFETAKEDCIDRDWDVVDVSIQRVEDDLELYSISLPMGQNYESNIWKETFREGVKYYIIEMILNSSIKNVDIDVIKNRQKYQNISELFVSSKKAYMESIDKNLENTGWGYRFATMPSQAIGA